MALPRIKPLSANTVTGVGTIPLTAGHLFGGYVLNTDGVNTATIVIRDFDAAGKILAISKTLSGQAFIAPIDAPSKIIHYTVNGAGGDAFLYEFDYARSTKY